MMALLDLPVVSLTCPLGAECIISLLTWAWNTEESSVQAVPTLSLGF